ncbi:hypothetical protein [Ruminococcus flavefaciens]|uniref:DUF3791 domain-containing protein n=1 Tax=Ruminococcus flavefaciens TaxID=1265 RepID=A0A315YKZ0_RUMFL|nr:hypothetical protein [Ruminococcus flavefaciens]PWJ12198.1 hypothetical protein IE37_01888 [Ruminococcus flavefaciens]SSA49688.1 hypothetical protein SAMN02910325_01888 [Ruminococcus flavefaciens]
MTKQDQLMEFCVQDIIERIVKEHNIDYDEAMNLFYSSQTFAKLNDIETGLYLESSDYVYTLFQDELNFGKIIQTEI